MLRIWSGGFSACLRRYRVAAAAALLAQVFLPARALAIPAGARDPFFSSTPFARWQGHGRKQDIRWDVEFSPVELSVHQRLLSRVRIQILRDPGQTAFRPLVILIEYRDGAGNVWQSHFNTQESATATEAPSSVFFGNAFVLPGAYLISVAAYDPDTLAHSFVSHRIRVKPLRNDPLPHAWDGLPAVEVLPAFVEPPDEWFLPMVKTRLTLRVPARRRVRLDVFVNETPGGNAAGSVGAIRRNMSVLVPALKVISQAQLAAGSLNVRMVDLSRRRIVFRQDAVQRLDWTRLRESFLDAEPGVIDAQSLAGFWKMRNYFWDQIGAGESDRSRAREARAVLVLSAPAFFPGQEKLPEDVGLGRAGDAVFYIRYRPPETYYRRMRARPGGRPPPPGMVVFPMAEDDLELAARKLNARIFDVTSAADFRRVLAMIFASVGEL